MTTLKSVNGNKKLLEASGDLQECLSATHASRNGVPLEIISKVILRHQDLKTTQIYLGKVSDAEAIRWMDSLHEK